MDDGEAGRIGKIVHWGRLAIEEAIAARLASYEPIPAPLPATPMKPPFVTLPTINYLKAALHMTLRAQELSRAELMRRLGWHREAVDRLFRIDHKWTLASLEQAFAALGIQLRIDVPFPQAA